MNLKQTPFMAPVSSDDRDPDNVLLRAGYLEGLAMRGDGLKADDREMLRRASRSLRAYAEVLRGSPA